MRAVGYDVGITGSLVWVVRQGLDGTSQGVSIHVAPSLISNAVIYHDLDCIPSSCRMARRWNYLLSSPVSLLSLKL